MRCTRCTGLRWHACLGALALVACLPTGDAPAGRHVIADRTLSAVQFSPTEQEGVPSYLLVSGPVYTEAVPDGGVASPGAMTVRDLYDVREGDPTHLPMRLAAAQPVVRGRPVLAGEPQGEALLADSLGRLVVTHRRPNNGDPTAFQLSRVDLASHKVVPLTSFALNASSRPRLSLSPWRTRAVLVNPNLEVFELENQRAWLEVNCSWLFWDEDLYYSTYNVATRRFEVGRLQPHGHPEVLAAAEMVTPFALAPSEANANLEMRLLLKREPDAFLVLDPQSGRQTALPVSPKDVAVSASGRWMSGTIHDAASNQDVLAVWDWAASEVRTLRPRSAVLTSVWRPGRDELWTGTRDGKLIIWTPPDQVRLIDAGFYALSGDGRFWFSSESREPDWAQIDVGLADAPEGPRYPMNPPGTHGLALPRTAGERVVMELWLDDEGSRFDFAVVEPATGQTRGLAVKGLLVALSPARALVFADWDLGREAGRLALFDLATGQETVLAEDVYAAAVDPGPHGMQPAADPLAPGTRLAFLVRHRFASPYDGLWVTELP